MGMITIKQASLIVDKVPLTVRRAIYKAPNEVKSTNDKGHLLIDESYITNLFAVNSNVLEQGTPIRDKEIDKLTKESDNRQDTINSLNDRLRDAFQVIGSQTKDISGLTFELSEQNKKILEAQKPIINDNDDQIKELVETIKDLENKINTPIETIQVKKQFPLMEVLSVVISVVACGILAYYVFNS